MRHLKIERSNGNYYLEDLRSAFGTMLNGRPLLSRVQIVQGDEISIGEFTISFINPLGKDATRANEEEVEIIGEDYFSRKFMGRESSHASVDTNEPVVASKEPEPLDAAEFYKLDDPPETAHESAAQSAAGQIPNGKSYQLLAIYGPYMGKKFALKFGDTKIGRDNTLNDIVIRMNEKGALDPSISRRHATISYKDGRFFVTDKRSKTRTYVNQIKLEPKDEIPLEEGDEIEIVSDQKSTIFRMLASEDYDLSPPQKAGVWWIRNNLRLGTVASILLGVIAVSTLGLSCMSRMTTNKKPGELKFIEERWFQTQNSRRASTPTSQSSNGADASGQPASLSATDVNGDGKVDLIFADQKRNLLALDGFTKKIIWMNEQIRVQTSIPVVAADLNANGLADVLVVGQDARLRALDGESGAEIWLSPILGDVISGPPVAADLNGDGLKDVAICAQSGIIHLGYAYINEMDWKRVAAGSPIRATPSAVDLSGDGTSEVLVGTEDGKVIMVDGRSGQIAKVFDFNEEISKATGESYSGLSIRSPIAVADFNHNGVPDLLIGSTNGLYLVVEGNAFTRLWHEQLDANLYSVVDILAPAAGKIDNNEVEDAVLISNTMIKVISGSTDPKQRKSVSWEYKLDTGLFVAPAALADLQKDGSQDVLIGRRDGSLIILNGRDGKALAQINNADNPTIAAPLVADLGGDGKLDVLLVRKDGSIYKIQTNSAIHKHSVVWGQPFGGEQHTSRYGYAPPKSRAYDLILAASGIIFVSVFGLNTVARKNRERIIRSNQR
jgi:pSer/pThr/pTyr-binding forkhead associated (FHA) protein/outer membrane protein assembly factor BamB